MNILQKTLMLFSILSVATVFTIPANAAVSLFTEHQIVYMTQHGVNLNQDVQFPSGKYPYIGKVGIEYDINKKFSTSLSYLHRSNIDITSGDEYNYNGISLGFKYKHCIYKCN